MSAVRKALEAHLMAMPQNLPSAMQNVGFKPVDGVPYQTVRLLMAQPDNSMSGNTFLDTGIFEVQLMYPEGAGPGPAEAQAELIRERFKRATTASHGGVNVRVIATPVIATGLVVNGRYAVPVSVSFQAQIVT